MSCIIVSLVILWSFIGSLIVFTDTNSEYRDRPFDSVWTRAKKKQKYFLLCIVGPIGCTGILTVYCVEYCVKYITEFYNKLGDE